MTPSARTLSTVLWVGLGALVAGRLLDLWWHSTHEGFETAGISCERTGWPHAPVVDRPSQLATFPNG